MTHVRMYVYYVVTQNGYGAPLAGTVQRSVLYEVTFIYMHNWQEGKGETQREDNTKETM